MPHRLREAFAALDRVGARWCLLRPAELLTQPQGDVDVLCDPGDREHGRRALVELGFMPMLEEAPDVHVADHDAAAGRFLWLHVQTELRVAGARFPAEQVLATVDPAGPPAPPAAWLFWILLLRGLLEKEDVPARHRPLLVQLASAAESDAAAPLEAVAARHGLRPDVVVPLAAAGRWQELRALVPPVGGEPGRARAVPDPRRLRRLRKGGGLTVAVLGPDGAGKSTLIAGLSRTLPLPTKVIYMGLTGGRMPRADALRVPGLVLLARLAIIWARYLLGRYHRFRGRVVLFDRYPLDGAVPHGFDPSPVVRASRTVQRRACPLPDLVLLLDASGATLHARSGEYDSERLESWRATYGRLRRTVEVLRVIDAEQPADAVLARAQALVWAAYRRRRTG